MSISAINLVRGATHVKGATRAVLHSLATFADRRGCYAFPSQATLAAACGFSDRTVRRALKWLEEEGIIQRTGGKRSRRGRAVIVWRIILSALKPDMVAGRTVRQLKKQKARQEKMTREGAFRILAGQYGWGTLQEWSAAAIERALSRIVERSGTLPARL